MRPLVEGELDLEGLVGDDHRAPGSARQLVLQDQEVLAELGLSAGVVKENITLRGIGVNALAPGTRLRVGDVVIEITKECRPCERMDEIRPGLRDELVGRRGACARVIEPGVLRVGDRQAW